MPTLVPYERRWNRRTFDPVFLEGSDVRICDFRADILVEEIAGWVGIFKYSTLPEFSITKTKLKRLDLSGEHASCPSS